MLDFGILGNNARNLLYIKKFNQKKDVRLADNKLKTKRFLSERGIPVPETYAVLKSRKELFNFDFDKIPVDNFVVKPNKGSKGKGIYIVKKVPGDSQELKEQTGGKTFGLSDFFKLSMSLNNPKGLHFKTGGEYLSQEGFTRILADIVDGKHSLTFGNDRILVEEKLIPGDGFTRYCKHGLADIRVIVFNLVPVAAMIRVPTESSEGKANLAQGGVGLGVEVGSGKINSMYHNGKIYSKDFPLGFEEAYLKKLPFWNDILLYSSRIQYFVNMGYLALDWVITDDGPKLLEINARAGLEVQSASNLPLKKRLQKLGDMKITDPEKGVEICKSLFNSSKSAIASLAKVVYLSQQARLIAELEEKDDISNIVVKVDPTKSKNYISKFLNVKVQNYKDKDIILDLFQNEIRFKNLKYIVSDSLAKNEIVLGKNAVEDCLIKPIEQVYSDINVINPEKLLDDEKEKLHQIDKKITSASRKLILGSTLKPLNYLEELDNFITWHGHYNPKFEYDWPEEKILTTVEENLKVLKEENFNNEFGIKSKFGSLLDEKIDEQIYKVKLFQAYRSQKFDDILKYNFLLFGPMNNDLVKLSKQKIFVDGTNDDTLLGPVLTFSQIKRNIKNYLEDLGIGGVKIVVDSTNLARMSIKRGKNIQIKLANNCKFREKELKATLAHEIDIHLVRYLNGLKTGWDILKSGTGGYTKHEEGLAIYNSFHELPDGYEKKGIYERYYLVDEAMKCHYSRLAEIIRGMKDCSLIDAFRYALRVKKGVQNTGFIANGAVFMKDKVYLEGVQDIRDFVANGGSIDQLMIGKIKLQDLEYII